MRKFSFVTIIACQLTLLALTGAANAQQASPTGGAVMLDVSTLGLGAELDWGFGSQVTGRIGFNGLSYTHNATESDVTYNAHLHLQSEEALVDLMPSRHSSFHFTTGLVLNSSHASATGQSNDGGYRLNGNTYTSEQVGTLSSSVKLPSSGWYLGMGFGNPAGKGPALRATADVGVILQGESRLLLNATGNPNTPDASGTSTLGADLAAQQQTTQNDINKYFKAYPVVMIGLGYHF